MIEFLLFCAQLFVSLQPKRFLLFFYPPSQAAARSIRTRYPTKPQQTIVATLDSLKSKVDKLQKNYDKISQECVALRQALLRKVFE